MSPVIDPMTFDELGEQYRVEMKSNSLTQPRRDLFRAMANLLTSLRQEYDRQMSVDPDSVMAEGADQRRKRAERICNDIMSIRTKKIAGMAILGAKGAHVAIENLTDEEREYYDAVQELSRRHLAEIDRLRGKRVTTATKIDEPPVRDLPPKEPVMDVPAEPAVPRIEDEYGPMDDEPPFDDEPFDEPPMDTPDEIPVEEPAIVEPEPRVELEPEETVVHEEEPVVEEVGMEPVPIRILEDLPEFAGPERDYKLSKEDVVTLPRALADVLVNTGKAIVVTPTP